MSDQTFYIGSLSDVPEGTSGFLGSLLDRAEESEVTIIHIPAGTSCTELEPIELHDVSTHVSIVLEAGATLECAIVLGDACINHQMELLVGAEASATVLTVHSSSKSNPVSIKQQSLCKEGGSVRWQNVSLGELVAHRLVSTCEGLNSRSDIDWMFYAKGTEKQDLYVRNIFNGNSGRGEILMRGIVEEKGHARAEGLIDIGLHGGGTDTYLTQEVLMLDPTSKVDAIPSLEIKTNDVKASHSATVARVTEEDLFYFGARGIDPKAAKEMFVVGFLGDITGRIASEGMKERVMELVGEKYGRQDLDYKL